MWSDIEASLGVTLPEDYKQLINTYGKGWFAGWIHINSPLTKGWDSLMSFSMMESVRDSIENVWAIKDTSFGKPFPEPGSLLTLGHDDGNSFFFYLTEGEPNGWKIVNFNNRFVEGYQVILPYTVTELLSGWFEGKIKQKIGGNQWYPEDIKPTKRRFFSLNASY
jgi:SMI1-KNR4 cell-wall